MTNPAVKTIKILAPMMDSGSEDSSGDTKVRITMEKSMQLMEDVGPVLSESIISITGVTDSHGGNVPLDIILTKFHFMNLVMILITNLFSMGEVSEEEEKKLEGTSDLPHKATPEELERPMLV